MHVQTELWVKFPCYSTVTRIFPHHVWHCNTDLGLIQGNQTMISVIAAGTADTLRFVTSTRAHVLYNMKFREVFHTVVKAQQQYADPFRMLTCIKIKPPYSNQYFKWDACSDEPTAFQSVFTHVHLKKKNTQLSIQFHLFNETDCQSSSLTDARQSRLAIIPPLLWCSTQEQYLHL